MTQTNILAFFENDHNMKTFNKKKSFLNQYLEFYYIVAYQKFLFI